MRILASNSPARQEMLRSAGVAFEAMAAAVDEVALRAQWHGLAAGEVAARLAEAKALAVSRQRPQALVLGADSVVELDGALLEKPGSRAGLCRQLQQLRGREHHLLSAAAFARGGRLLWRHVGEARLFMRDFGDSFLGQYVERVDAAVLQSVGGYHVEGLGVQLFDRIDGSLFVIRGLPLLAVLGFLRDAGELQ